MTPNKQPSRELQNYLVELRTRIEKLKTLYKAIDKQALAEGFNSEEIYDIANITDASSTATIRNNLYTHFH